jgi:hypothetical protein
VGALARRASVEIVAFVDPDVRRQERAFLSTAGPSVDWLRDAAWDLVAVSGVDPHAWRFSAGGTDVRGTLDSTSICNKGDVFIVVHATVMPDMVAQVSDYLNAVRACPPMAGMPAVSVPGDRTRVSRAQRLTEGISIADAVWFADNNPQQQGRDLLGLEVIAPSDIPGRPFDAVVIGSMSRDPIRRQLLDLSIPASAILTPDVIASIADLQRDLATAIAGSQTEPLLPRAQATR